jgi:autotransporter-associated beta strand protein
MAASTTFLVLGNTTATVDPSVLVDIRGGVFLGSAGGAALLGANVNISATGRLELGSQNPSIQNLTGSGTVSSSTASATIRVGAGDFSGVMTDSGSGVLALNKIGAGTLTLTGVNTYTGGTTINAGTLQLGNGGANGSIVGNVVDNGVFQVNHSDALTFGGIISGTGSFAQVGSGTTILTAANSYSGGTTIAAGTLAAGADNNLGAATGGIAFTGPATLQFLSSFATSRAVSLNATGTFDTQANTDTLGGVISGPGGLTKVGSGTLILNAANTYTGPTTINAGTLQTGIANALSTATAVTVASGASFNLNSFNQSIGSLAGGGNVVLGAAILTTGNDGTSTTSRARSAAAAD